MMGLSPYHPLAVLLIALLNPAVIAVGIAMGRRADQPQKLLIAGFAAACAGSILVWLAAEVRLLPAKGIGGVGGEFMLQIVFGMAWAALGYYRLRGDRAPPRSP